MSDALRQLWTAQERQAAPPPEAELRARSRRLYRQLALRNGIEHAAGALAALVFAYYAVAAPSPIVSLGAVAVIAAIGVTLVNVHRRRGRDPSAKPDFALDCRAFLRAELARQHRALRTVWRWYLLPLGLGISAFLLSVFAYAGGRIGFEAATEGLIPVLGVVIGIGIVTYWINSAAARKLGREIERLDAEDYREEE